MGKLSSLSESKGDWLYLIFRVLVGLLFFLHGWGKIFGEQPATGIFMVAGIIELIVGAGVFLGFYTKGLALVGAIQMLVAYFKVHIGNGLNPLVNGGELAVLFFVAFLVLVVYGAKKWSLERKLLKKETF
jgi:putative oxidoreductase